LIRILLDEHVSPSLVGKLGDKGVLAVAAAHVETHQKIKGYPELQAWRAHKVFVIGGGSLVPLLVEKVRVHAGRQTPLQVATLEQPPDLVRSDNRRITGDDLPFITVAYGLSNIGLSIPEAFTPDQVPSMPDRTARRDRLDNEDIYSK
jgi:hypothetical protein